MKEEDFFEKIYKHQLLCKEPAEGDGGFNIKRGMAKVSSGYIEDLFARYLAEKINRHDLQYLIDKPTSIKLSENGKAITFKPDLTILDSKNILTHYFDLKTNLGWNRNIKDYMDKKDKFIKKIRGRKAWIRFGKDNVRDISISPNLRYKMVVIYGGNINQSLLNENIRLVTDFECVDLYVLFNHYEDRIHTEDFLRLHEDTAINLSNFNTLPANQPLYEKP